MKMKTLEDAVKRYGEIDFEKKVWPNEKQFMKTLIIPKDLVFLNWVNVFTQKPVEKLYANIDMHGPLLKAFENLKRRGVSDELETFDGLFNIRFVRGQSGRPSTHAYGLAVDLNADENQLGGAVKLSKGFIECWTDAGFTAGAHFKRTDGQHFSYGWE